MDLLGTSSTENTSEGTGFAGKIEQLKKSITDLVTKSGEKKTGNMEKVDSIKNKIIKIKESVANILSVKDQFATTSELLKEANAKVAKCQEDLLGKGKELEDLKTKNSAEIKELQGQLDDVNKTNDMVSGDYEKQLANQKTEHDTAISEKEAEITKLNDELQNNIAEVSSITEQIDQGMQTIGDDGEALSTALTELENEVDGLQSSMNKTEETIDDNNKVQAETVEINPVEESGNAPDIDETGSIESSKTSLPDESSVESTPESSVESTPEGTEREKLIKKIKHEYLEDKKDAAEQGNLDPEGKLKKVAVEKLKKWDENNRDRPELGSKFGLKDILPGDKTYISTAHLGLTQGQYSGGGSKKNKSTRKKRKAKKTQKRKKRSSRK